MIMPSPVSTKPGITLRQWLFTPARPRPVPWDVENFAFFGAMCGFVLASLAFSLRATPHPPSSSLAILLALLLATLAGMSLAAVAATLRNVHLRKRRFVRPQ
jgi:hypothetical protein